MRFLIDADSSTVPMTGQLPVLRERLSLPVPGEIGISAISYAEIVLGMANGKPPTWEALDAFISVVPVQDFDERAARAFARLSPKHARFDRLLDAHALSIGAIVVTNNEADFADAPGLVVENWTV